MMCSTDTIEKVLRPMIPLYLEIERFVRNAPIKIERVLESRSTTLRRPPLINIKDRLSRRTEGKISYKKFNFVNNFTYCNLSVSGKGSKLFTIVKGHPKNLLIN